MEKRASTFGVSEIISAAASALYGEVTNTRAPQSLTMYATSSVVSREDIAV
ncbi:MAG: Uncharacterised protein [Acidimicrobiales bacterium AG-410-I20]|nr:MAG: Uncharacterised protein [Acidimicrobiales bacterium AG-410-I20]